MTEMPILDILSSPCPPPCDNVPPPRAARFRRTGRAAAGRQCFPAPDRVDAGCADADHGDRMHVHASAERTFSEVGAQRLADQMRMHRRNRQRSSGYGARPTAPDRSGTCAQPFAHPVLGLAPMRAIASRSPASPSPPPEGAVDPRPLSPQKLRSASNSPLVSTGRAGQLQQIALDPRILQDVAQIAQRSAGSSPASRAGCRSAGWSPG
jgi:hypothetical protein